MLAHTLVGHRLGNSTSSTHLNSASHTAPPASWTVRRIHSVDFCFREYRCSTQIQCTLSCHKQQCQSGQQHKLCKSLILSVSRHLLSGRTAAAQQELGTERPVSTLHLVLQPEACCVELNVHQQELIKPSCSQNTF